MAQCDTSTAIFGRVVTRLDVTLPPFQRIIRSTPDAC